MKDISHLRNRLGGIVGGLKSGAVVTPAGDHLNDLDSAFYVDKLLSPVDMERVERHLKNCLKCAIEMEKYVIWIDALYRKEALEKWRESHTLEGVTATGPTPAEKKDPGNAEERLEKLQKAVENFLFKANMTPPWESAAAVWGSLVKGLNNARIDSLQVGKSKG